MGRIQTVADMLDAAHSIEIWSQNLLDSAPLTTDQRDDMCAVQDAAQKFMRLVQAERDIIRDVPSADEARRVRHALRNHLNIMVGFTHLLVNQLPDNLLLYMMLVRNIHSTAQSLMTRVDAIE